MALEAVIFTQDLLASHNCYKDYNNLHSCGVAGWSNPWTHDVSNSSDDKLEDMSFVGIFDDTNMNYYTTCNSLYSPSDIMQNVNQCNDQQQLYLNCDFSNSSPDVHNCSAEQYVSPRPEISVVGRRKRRRKSTKNKEEVEQQRMTHIAVERNRRKQMNEYLAVIRSLMPASYAHRGDQASIVGGAINYVKELEQLLQSLEAQKRGKIHGQRQKPPQEAPQEEQPPEDETAKSPVFSDFFSFPQYSNRSLNPHGGGNSVSCNSAGEIEVTMVESHANVKILAKKQPKQLLQLVAGFQGLRLSILHLNVTTLDAFVLYSFSLKVEDGCQLNSVDEIAAAANGMLEEIQGIGAGFLQ